VIRRRTVGAACALLAVVGLAGGVAATSDRVAVVTRAPRAQLVASAPVVLGETRVERFQQRVDGIDVLGAEAIVAVDAGRPARVITDATRDGLSVPDGPRVSRERAIDTAIRSARVRELRDPAPEATLAVDPSVRGGRLVWHVEISSSRPTADLETIVDAATGRVIDSRHLEVSDTATAMVFDPNPVVANGGTTGLADDKDKDSPLLDSLRVPVTLDHLNAGMACLEGAFVRALVTRRSRPVCDPDRDFSDVTRSQVTFEALMAYFHIDRLQTYIQSLGVGDVNNRQTRVIANWFRFDNSFYLPRDETIRLGRGGVDDGEDADVIVHEYGHAIQDAQVRRYGRSRDARALGEGFGDYLAAVASAEFSPVSTHEDDVCIFDWDATAFSLGRCIRRADMTRTLAEAQAKCRRQIHCVGQVWSSSLFRLREALGDDALGRSVVDRVVLASHFLEKRDVTFPEAGRAVECADEMLYPAGAVGDCVGEHHAAIHAELVSAGILP
jgi:hypothetical protein